MTSEEIIKNIYFCCKWGLYNAEKGLNNFGYEGFTKERVDIESAYIYKGIINMIEKGIKCQPNKKTIKKVENWYKKRCANDEKNYF